MVFVNSLMIEFGSCIDSEKSSTNVLKPYGRTELCQSLPCVRTQRPRVDFQGEGENIAG